MKNWTENEIPNQAERVALITGANSGIGFETARALAQKGATIIMACRSTARGQEARQQLLQLVPGAEVMVMELDLSDLESVRRFATAFQRAYAKLDLLINNAGVMIPPYTQTKQGHELQFGTNYLGHFALTGLLLPLMREVENSRIVTVSSLAGNTATIDFDDLHSTAKPYKKWDAYGQSKLAELVFSFELARRLAASPAKTIAVSAHPGGSNTNLQRTTGFFLKHVVFPLLSHAPDKAALPSLLAAVAPMVTNGTYWGPSGFNELKGAPHLAKVPAAAQDALIGQRLWQVGEELTGVAFDLQPAERTVAA
ncbi:oxidoreductase [Hymenobacter metallicola]|uniref:SDR family NAD(P)-dependent oxidoreductase n=1 Tax=Hymenobacter metallicola TaxID=2563114 RepID=A0A4Z0PZK4_9BACT|nr:oxidoreductase [Hymenobacter metallicola]TGE22749.1 SDR family NAD(P)-dependent oxidoreductase [Hymenobacter metallicola]